MKINKLPQETPLAHKALFKCAITLLESYLNNLGYKAQIHFELEGCLQFDKNSPQQTSLNFAAINKHLRQVSIDGELVTEYWQNQWEYVSLFNGQTPLKEADNLARAIEVLPKLFQQYYAKFGITNTLIQPVVWSGDKGKLAEGSSQIFTHDNRAVHIPNAVQLNVSVLNDKEQNLVAEAEFGEYLQQCFLRTSLESCLLYLPEEAAFERLALKTQFGLAQELCSPIDISGGHQGSVALYRELGKHNQHMGEQVLLYDQYHQVLSAQHNWQKTARIEHRLGASSKLYNPYANVIYALLNVIDAIEAYENGELSIVNPHKTTALPTNLYTTEKGQGAVELFKQSTWFNQSINMIQKRAVVLDCPTDLGDTIKQAILANYQVALTS